MICSSGQFGFFYIFAALALALGRTQKPFLSALTIELLAFRFLASAALELLWFNPLLAIGLVAAVLTATLPSTLPSFAEAETISCHAPTIGTITLNFLEWLILRYGYLQQIVDMPVAYITSMVLIVSELKNSSWYTCRGV